MESALACGDGHDQPMVDAFPGTDGTAVDIDALGTQIIGLAGRLAASTCRWLLLIAAFDARDGAARFGLPTTARWLAHYCGLSRRTARDHVRVARTLAAHPAPRRSMSAGRISYSHVRAIARVADLGTDTLVQNLVMVAEHGTVGQLEEMVLGLRSVDDNHRDSDDPDPEALSHRWRPDSRLGLSARLDPEHGALLLSAVDAIARAESIPHAEALTRMAEIALAAPASAGPAPSLRADEYAAVVVHLDAASLPPEPTDPGDAGDAGGSAEPAPDKGTDRPHARIAAGPGLPHRVARRLLCSGRIRTVVTGRPPTRTGPPVPLDIGASRRVVSAKQYRALLLRDRGCAHPGCASPTGLEAHHVRHWITGGPTVLANLVLLCRRHHHGHHDGQFTITAAGAGRFRFTRADGHDLPQHVDASIPAAAQPDVDRAHPDVPADAATTRWDGSRLDHDYAITALSYGLHTVRRLIA